MLKEDPPELYIAAERAAISAPSAENVRRLQADRHRREDWIVTALLALLVIAAFANVVFDGRSLVGSDSHNPLDYRMRGPNPVPVEEWSRTHFKHCCHHLQQFGLVELAP